MNNNNPGRERAVDEASQWLVRLHEDSVSDADLEAWGDWMAKSPLNARAFDDVSALWEASATVSARALDQAIHSKAKATKRSVVGAPRRRWLTGAAIAAACGLVAIGMINWLPGSPVPHVVETAKGERRQVVLADGSTVVLDADSRLTVELSGKTRELVLERGRAHFSVAHDASRPFRVQAGGVVSQAIGTRFGVAYRNADRVSVVVDEGRVRVSQLEGSPERSREAGKNERIGYSVQEGLEGPTRVNADLALSWKEGNVVYQSEPLSAVIEDLNRYSSIPLKLEDASMGPLLVTGRWESGSIDNWIAGLASALHLDVIREKGVIVLATRGHSSEQGQPAGVPVRAP